MTDISDKYGLMRKLSLNDQVSITLPVHVWIGFMSTYAVADWSAADASAIFKEVQNELYDPIWRREQEAEHQRKHTEHERRIKNMFPPGFPFPDEDGPDVPPDAGGLSGDDSA